MKATEQIRFDKLYERPLRALKLQGISDSTIDVYARAVRRLSEKNIVANHNGQVTFQYIESKRGKTQTRTLKGEDFLLADSAAYLTQRISTRPRLWILTPYRKKTPQTRPAPR